LAAERSWEIGRSAGMSSFARARGDERRRAMARERRVNLIVVSLVGGWQLG
jgi:hypothetical protein